MMSLELIAEYGTFLSGYISKYGNPEKGRKEPIFHLPLPKNYLKLYEYLF